jgi:hypothetical protein
MPGSTNGSENPYARSARIQGNLKHHHGSRKINNIELKAKNIQLRERDPVFTLREDQAL